MVGTQQQRPLLAATSTGGWDSFTISQEEAPTSDLAVQYNLKAPAENGGPAFIFSN